MLLTLFEKIRKSSRWRDDLRPAGKTQMKTKQNSAKVGSLNFRAVMTAAAHDTWHFQHVQRMTRDISNMSHVVRPEFIHTTRIHTI